jgi:hypothetical protein
MCWHRLCSTDECRVIANQFDNFNLEMIMSKSAYEKTSPQHAQRSESTKQESSIVGVSPDDPIGIEPEGPPSKPPEEND